MVNMQNVITSVMLKALCCKLYIRRSTVQHICIYNYIRTLRNIRIIYVSYIRR